eukprot:m.126172 g.126172  ORF g.126172 m.126172 type:complete len:320 (-) comp52230_c0_seq4:91-1050(-)
MDESVAGDWPFPFLDDADPPQLSNAELQMLWDQTFAGEPFGSPHGQHNDENFQLDLEMDARFGMDPQLRGQQVPAQLQPLASYRTATDQDRARDGGATVVVQSQQPQSIEEFLGGPDAEEDSKTSQPDWVTMPHEAGQTFENVQTLAFETTESAVNQAAVGAFGDFGGFEENEGVNDADADDDDEDAEEVTMQHEAGQTCPFVTESARLLCALRLSIQPSASTTSTTRDARFAAACDKTGLTNDEIKNAEQKPLNAYLSFLVEHNILTKAEDKLVRRFRRYLKSKDDRQRYEDNGHRPPRPPKGADKPSKSTSKPYARK